MATITEVVNSFEQNSKEYDTFLHDLLTVNDDIPFDTEEVDTVQNAIISAINSRLNQANTRCKGLLLLDQILPRISKDILSKYGILWISKAIQVLENIHSGIQDVTLTCKVIGMLIIQSKEISEIQKQISMQCIKQIVTAINNLEPSMKCGALYYLIAVVLYHYPEVCEKHQVVIRKLILSQLDSSEGTLVHASAKCYALLARATERSFRPPSSQLTCTGWIYSQLSICNTLHAIMDDLFVGLIDLENVDTWYTLELPSISTDNVIEFYSGQKQRFVNLCDYLSFMLCGYEEKNSVSPQEILQVLCRGLAITPLSLKGRNTLKEQMLYLLLPKLHISLLSVLDALINGFKQELIPFGSAILQLFNQTLQWTGKITENQVTMGGSKAFKYVRASAFKCLSSWLMCTNLSSGVETVADEYLPSILKEIIPERDRVLLTVQKPQHLSKKALKRLRDSQYEKKISGNNASKASNLDANLCKEALIALQNIFFSGSIWLKQTFYKAVQNVIIPLLYDLYLNCAEQNFYRDNVECRLQLLMTLKALEMNPHPSIPPPTQYSLEIFEIALNDIDVQITQEAKLALAELEKIVHPIAPSLQLSKPEELEEDVTSNEEDTSISESSKRNPNESNALDEDITPSLSKRLRINAADAESNLESTDNSTNELLKEQNNQVPSENDATVPLESEKMIIDDETVHEQNPVSEPTQKDTLSNEDNNNIEIEPAIENVSEPVEPALETENTTENVCSEVSEQHRETTPERSSEDKADNVQTPEKSVEDQTNVLSEEDEEKEILRLFYDEPKES